MTPKVFETNPNKIAENVERLDVLIGVAQRHKLSPEAVREISSVINPLAYERDALKAEVERLRRRILPLPLLRAEYKQPDYFGWLKSKQQNHKG